MGKDDVFTDLLLRNFVFVVIQEAVFDFVESLFVKWFTSHEVKTLAFESTKVGWQQTLKKELDSELGLTGTRLSIYFIQLLWNKTTSEEISEHITSSGQSQLSINCQLKASGQYQSSSICLLLFICILFVNLVWEFYSRFKAFDLIAKQLF